MTPSIRAATPGDLDALLAMMERLYEEDGIAPFHGAAHRRAAEVLLASPDAGHIDVVADGDRLVGYAVMTWGHSLEFGGRFALLDEIYLTPDHRGRGWATRLLERCETRCRGEGAQAIRLEVERSNAAAEAFYRRRGFQQERRHLYTRRLRTSEGDP